MHGCHPALVLTHPSGEGDSIPQASDVAAVLVDGLEDAGWTSPADILVDVRESTLPIQHEAPPESPIVRRGVIAAFAQTEITRQHGYPGVFQVATDALREEYLDCELHVDAISLRPTAPLNPTFPGP